MKSLRMTMIIAGVLAMVAGTAIAGDFHELGKVNTKDMPDPILEGAAGLLDCTGAIEVDLGVGVYYGDNTGLPNNVTTYGCTTWTEGGGEVVYHVVFPDGVTWEVGLSDMTCDLDLILLDSCDETLGCLQAFNVGVFTETPVPGDFYFVVDGYNGAECAYTLTFTTTPYVAPDPVDFCALVEPVNGGSYFTGDTCDGANNVSAVGCEDYTENGFEDYYEIFMPAGSSFTADVTNTSDGALWVLDACAEPFNCLAYADATFTGDTESVTYTNASASDIYVYLVVDSYSTDSCGTYTFDFLSTGGAVAEEAASFGTVKSMFR